MSSLVLDIKQRVVLFVEKNGVINAKAIITDKKFLSKKELIYIMQELNPTYISKKEKVKKFNR